MKKTYFIYLSVILLLLLTGCGGQPALLSAPTADPALNTTPQKGGAIVVTYKDDLATLDPAIGYDATNWPAIKMVFDGLLDYDSNIALEPRLAEALPQVSADGLTYTFKIRKGVKFQNGRELVADDVVYSITRVINPETGSPGAGFFMGIQGAREFVDGKSISVSGIQAIDPTTVAFTLTTPDVTFMNKMALNFAYIVPREEVEKAGGNFGHKPVGTGPFILKDWVADQQLVFERNPNYFFEGRPFLDKITIKMGVDPSDALLQLEKGEIQLIGDPPPADDWTRIATDPAWKNRIEIKPAVNTTYIAINVTQKPFDNVKVRQALNYAIDKGRIVQLLNGRATAANQILPPLMPGYDKSYTGYEYNPDKAKKLLADAGFPNGFETSIECISVDPQLKICESFQQDLARVGIKLTNNTSSPANVINFAQKGKSPLVWTGGLAWTQDYPDPDDFYTPILSCATNLDGEWNWSRYCNQILDAQSKELLTVADRNARMTGYAAFFKTLMDEAVWVPVINGNYTIAHSEKLIGQPTLTHPEHLFLFETMWLSK